MRGKVNSVPSETPSAPNQPALPRRGIKRFGKKPYAVIAIAAVAVIAVALLIPQGAAIIPLSVEYTVGERMVYNNTQTVTMQLPTSTVDPSLFGQGSRTTTMNSTTTVDVIDFDGEAYTLNHTTSMEMLGHPFSISLIEKVNKTGYSTLFFAEGTQMITSNVSTSNPVLTGLLEKPEVRVGESWEIPLSTNNASIGMTGSMTLTFRGIQDITVPAGTYKVFRVDMSSNNVGMNTEVLSPYGGTTTLSSTMSISAQYYVEYETGCHIEYDMQMTTNSVVLGINSTTSFSASSTLVQHIKP